MILFFHTEIQRIIFRKCTSKEQHLSHKSKEKFSPKFTSNEQNIFKQKFFFSKIQWNVTTISQWLVLQISLTKETDKIHFYYYFFWMGCVCLRGRGRALPDFADFVLREVDMWWGRWTQDYQTWDGGIRSFVCFSISDHS